MKLVWSAHSLTDRDDIFTYIVADNPKAAVAVDGLIEEAAEHLVAFPESGRPGRVEGTRERVISRTPYIVVYAFGEDTIRILRVLHGARNWPGET